MPPQKTQPPFVALGAMPMWVLRQAYSAAVRREATSVGTLDVLSRVALHDKWVPPWLLAGSGRGLVRMAVEPRRMRAPWAVGEFVSGSISEFDAEVQASLREVEWSVKRLAGGRRFRKIQVRGLGAGPQWTHGVRVMVAGALAAARDNDVPFANLCHLLLGMLHLPNCDGTRYLFPYEYARRAAVERLRREPWMRRADPPHPDLDEERVAIWPNSGSLLDRLAGHYFARLLRVARVGPILVGVQGEARRQAVRLGHDVVGPAHILLAMLTHDAILDAARLRVPAHHSSRNRGASVLRAKGVDGERLRELATCRGAPEEPPAEVLSKQLNGLRPGDPFNGAEAMAAMERAMEISLAYRHADTGTTHLLFALLEDDGGDGVATLRALGVDPEAVRERVEHDLRVARAAWPPREG